MAEIDWAAARARMVARQLAARGIIDRRVLVAMGELPREEFVPPQSRAHCYEDEPVPIGHGQTMSQPYMAALMTQTLTLTGEENVLEVGSGCGYHAALLGRLSRHVVTVERVPELAAMAMENLRSTRTGDNVQVVCGDGSLGWRPLAPYDAILVAAGAPDTPERLLEQLTEGGRMVIPVGGWHEQELELVERRSGKLHRRVVAHCRFVPLVGEEGWDAE